VWGVAECGVDGGGVDVGVDDVDGCGVRGKGHVLEAFGDEPLQTGGSRECLVAGVEEWQFGEDGEAAVNNVAAAWNGVGVDRESVARGFFSQDVAPPEEHRVPDLLQTDEMCRLVLEESEHDTDSPPAHALVQEEGAPQSSSDPCRAAGQYGQEGGIVGEDSQLLCRRAGFRIIHGWGEG